MVSTSRGLLAVLLFAALILNTEASIYSRRRGLKTAGLSEEEIDEVMKHHEPQHVLHREKHKEDLKEHPEVKRYLEWKEKQKAGHPEASAAFVGKIPHDYIPHLIDHKKEEL